VNVDIAKDVLGPLNVRDRFLPSIQSIHSSLVSLVCGFSLLEPFLTVRFEDLPLPQASPPPPAAVSNDDNGMILLCRICECYVPLSMLEAHSQSCQLVYQTRSNVDSINVRIQHLKGAHRDDEAEPPVVGRRVAGHRARSAVDSDRHRLRADAVD
jgi:hypothetical protein